MHRQTLQPISDSAGLPDAPPKDVRSNILSGVPRTTITCSHCGGKDVTDYEEFGYPGGYRFFCNDCKYLWHRM